MREMVELREIGSESPREIRGGRSGSRGEGGLDGDGDTEDFQGLEMQRRGMGSLEGSCFEYDGMFPSVGYQGMRSECSNSSDGNGVDDDGESLDTRGLMGTLALLRMVVCCILVVGFVVGKAAVLM